MLINLVKITIFFIYKLTHGLCFLIPYPEPALRRGDSVYLVGLSRSLQATSRKSIVTNPCAALNIGSADCPRYRATNMEVIELDTGMVSIAYQFFQMCGPLF